MNGEIEHDGKEFKWWAGRASQEAEARFCVHCWRKDYGVTRYYDYEPDHAEAEKSARKLAPAVARL